MATYPSKKNFHRLIWAVFSAAFFMFFGNTVHAQGRLIPEATLAAGLTTVDLAILKECPKCIRTLSKIQVLDPEKQIQFVADPVGFGAAHPEILAIPAPDKPSFAAFEGIESAASQREVSAGEEGPTITENSDTTLNPTASQMLAMRKWINQGLTQISSSSAEASTPDQVPSLGNPFVRAEEGEGNVPTSQDPQNAPPSNGGSSDGGVTGEAQPPREVEAPKDLQPTVGGFFREVWNQSTSAGPLGLLVGVVRTVLRSDENPNAPVYREPTPEIAAAVQNRLGKGIVNGNNSDPTYRSVQSMEDPNRVVYKVPQSTGGFIPTIHDVVDSNVVDPNPEGGAPAFEAGPNTAGCGSGVGSPVCP